MAGVDDHGEPRDMRGFERTDLQARDRFRHDAVVGDEARIHRSARAVGRSCGATVSRLPSSVKIADANVFPAGMTDEQRGRERSSEALMVVPEPRISRSCASGGSGFRGQFRSFPQASTHAGFCAERAPQMNFRTIRGRQARLPPRIPKARDAVSSHHLDSRCASAIARPAGSRAHARPHRSCSGFRNFTSQRSVRRIGAEASRCLRRGCHPRPRRKFR